MADYSFQKKNLAKNGLISQKIYKKGENMTQINRKQHRDVLFEYHQAVVPFH